MKEKKEPKKKAINLPPDFEGLSPEEIRKKAKRELKALKEEELAQIEMLKRLSDEFGEKLTLSKVADKLFKRSLAFFAKCKDHSLSQQLFKTYYEDAGLKFKKDDLNEIRGNMLRAGRKLYALHRKRVKTQEN